MLSVTAYLTLVDQTGCIVRECMSRSASLPVGVAVVGTYTPIERGFVYQELGIAPKPVSAYRSTTMGAAPARLMCHRRPTVDCVGKSPARRPADDSSSRL